jgi:hypothetical protein
VETGEERFADLFPDLAFADADVHVAVASPDGSRVAVAARGRLSAWAVGGDLLQSILAESTTVCLSPDFRRQNLGESAADARRAFDACERRHGRE